MLLKFTSPEIPNDLSKVPRGQNSRHVSARGSLASSKSWEKLKRPALLVGTFGKLGDEKDLFWSNYSDRKHDRFPPNGGLVREIPLFQGNLGW